MQQCCHNMETFSIKATISSDPHTYRRMLDRRRNICEANHQFFSFSFVALFLRKPAAVTWSTCRPDRGRIIFGKIISSFHSIGDISIRPTISSDPNIDQITDFLSKEQSVLVPFLTKLKSLVHCKE